MSIEATQELAARYGAAWAEHDLDAILAMHTDDTVFHLHGFSEPATGLAAVREVIAATFARSPDLRFEKSRTSEGKPFACEGVDVIAVSDGLIARKDTYLDWAAMQRQLDSELTASA